MQDSEDEICYGALFGTLGRPCAAGKNAMRHAGVHPTSLFSSFKIIEHGPGMFSLSADETQIAVVDVRTASKLALLRQIPGVRYEAVVETRIVVMRKTKSAPPFAMSINVFGPRNTGDVVFRVLLKAKTFLQHPEALHPDVEYCNPDAPLIFPGQQAVVIDPIGTFKPASEASQLSQDVDRILDSLSLVADGDELSHVEGLVSTLTNHQQDGVRFILRREDAMACKALSDSIRQITGAGHTETESELPGLGGIIADVMGIGKTLTILASILHSSEKARDFSFFGYAGFEVASNITLTKATLVVVPSVQLMENWESEITIHFSKNALQYARFHGSSRPQTLEALTAPDIVITTYATLVADRNGSGVLHLMEWYRIVLDEAHEIRNPSSKQWQAAVTLRTRRRWCLSGTPVQNKLEDLAALVGFLQLPPIRSKESFEKYILRPLSEPGTNPEPLRAYMQAYCLRRSESCLALPDSRDEVVPLHLSPPERIVYDQVLENARRQIDELVSSGKQVRCAKLFTALLRMRMICNTGTLNSDPASAQFLTSQADSKQSDIQNQCERCSASDDDTRMLLSNLKVCPDCMRPLHQRSPSPLSQLVSQLEDVAVSANGTGFSTKLDAVVKMILSAGISGSKAIIFSYWKTTLQLLSRLLQDVDVVHLQVDGDTSFADRSNRLKAFKEDSSVHVLLMTVGTGAVGLNLTVANQVHIVEPQWNPSVEEQAVARAVRMGQKREVTIYRYVLQNTVEKNVVKLQERKRNLAKYTLGTKSEQSISDAVQELESVLELNPRKRGFDER